MNFFDVAKKECDQDNFIQWLLLSYDSDDKTEKEACHSFLKMLIPQFSSHEKIKKLKVKREVELKHSGRIDLLCGIETSENVYLLAIEDKVNACVNNDLCGYKKDIIEDKDNILERIQMDSSETETIFILIKTGHTSESDKKNISKSNFKLIKKDGLASCLKPYEGSIFIKQFLEHLNYSKNTKLTAFSNKKATLADILNDELKCQTIYKDRKFVIKLTDKNECKLEIRNFSLSAPELNINLIGKSKKKINSCYFHLIKKSKKQKIGERKIKNNQISTLGDLISILREAVCEAKKCIEEP